MIEGAVLLATDHKGEACQFGEYGPGALLAIKPQQGTRLEELVGGEGAGDRRARLASVLSVVPMAVVPKTAEPVGAVSLQNRCARPNNLPALAPGGARGTDLLSS